MDHIQGRNRMHPLTWMQRKTHSDIEPSSPFLYPSFTLPSQWGNRKSAINGYIYCNMPKVSIPQGKKVSSEAEQRRRPAARAKCSQHIRSSAASCSGPRTYAPDVHNVHVALLRFAEYVKGADLHLLSGL